MQWQTVKRKCKKRYIRLPILSPRSERGVRVQLFSIKCASTATVKSPLNQVATIAIPEARAVVIQPFDKSLIGDIEKAIQAADLGLNPSNDGKVIRIAIPPLTADRRKELVKQAKADAENYRTQIRNIRRDGNDALKKQQKSGELTEDGLKSETDKLQKLTDKYIAEIQKLYDAKEKEILEG